MHIRALRITGALLALGVMLSLVSCDWSARWDLKRAEKALKEADHLNAEFWANNEYVKAQKAFEEAMALNRVRAINEARDKAVEAKDWAEEAINWAKIRAAEMEQEKAGVHSKKY
jgi:hypothetical protein